MVGHIHDGHVRVTYQDIHVTIGKAAIKIKQDFNPHLMIAIGGGGFAPARILRTFLKSDKQKNIPIQAIGLSLYEDLGDGAPTTDGEEVMGMSVVRTQWLDFSTLGNRPLLGKRILIVDEVDDSRSTLVYAVTELRKDIEAAFAALSEEDQKACPPTQLGIFVVHNKLKTKLAELPSDVPYFAGDNIEDKWVDYPWEQTDILLHDELAAQQKALGL